MRCLVRNAKTFYYAPYLGKTDMVDEYGNLTGESEIQFGHPVKLFGNVSSAKGEMQTRQFGESESYDRVIVLDNADTPVNEYTILWVDSLPHLEADGSTHTPHDYIVKQVARSLNSVSIAISKVQVNG
jgi:hypothetical protein